MSFIIYRLSLIVDCWLFIVYRLSFIVYRLSFIVYRLSFIVYSLFIIHYSLFIIHYSLFIIHYTLYIKHIVYIVSCLFLQYMIFTECRLGQWMMTHQAGSTADWKKFWSNSSLKSIAVWCRSWKGISPHAEHILAWRLMPSDAGHGRGSQCMPMRLDLEV